MIKIGTMIGDRYEVLERIGMGGMSDVYKAKDHKLNRHVAVKVLKQEFSENTNFVSKFRVEAQAAASLMHPNIVNVYDVGEDNGVYYIVMELVDGITLKKYIEKKARLSVREALSIAIQACMGIEAAHNNHIIHRDIKPQNIIISKDGKVKVTDFGIAKAATSNTITSNVMGSVHYTSPEQARGGYSDEKSDIYSMGITLFEMLTGRVPFNGETTVAIAIKHIQEEMPSPREYVPEIPVCVEQIVLKCTQKSPDRRYHSMAALIADLKKALMSPNEDFVQIENPDEAMATRTVTSRERKEINESRNKEATEGTRLKKNETPQKPKKKKQPVYEEPEEDEEDDEDEEYDDDSRMEKITTLLAIIGAVLIGCAVIFLVGRAVGIFNFGATSAQVTVENVTGKSAAEAQKILEDLGLKVKFAYETSDTVAEETSTDNAEQNDSEQAEETAVTEDDGEQATDSQESNVTIETASDSGNYFEQAKMNKETSRSKSLEILNQTAENESFDADIRKKAGDKILEEANNVQKESEIESIAQSKGYSEICVYVDGSEANIMVRKDGFSDEDVVKLTSIATEQLKISAQNIKIVEVK